jgi:hypothetical protein
LGRIYNICICSCLSRRYIRELFGVGSRPLRSVRTVRSISIPSTVFYSLYIPPGGRARGMAKRGGIWPETHSMGGEAWYGVTVCLVSGIQTSRKMLEGPTGQLHFLSTNYSVWHYSYHYHSHYLITTVSMVQHSSSSGSSSRPASMDSR